MADEEARRKPMDADLTMSPVDLPGDDAPDVDPLRWTNIVIAIAASFLLLTNAITIDDWAGELPPSAGSARLLAVSGGWAAITDTVGLGGPRAFVHARWKRIEAVQFQQDRTAR